MIKTQKETFAISKTIRKSPPGSGLLYERIKNAVLGKNYSLSLAFIGEKRSRTLNKNYRHKNKPTDILSFPLSKKEGEIFINPDRAKIESRKFGRSYENFLLFLLIHGFCHLKGMAHGSRMEREEKKFRAMFDV